MNITIVTDAWAPQVNGVVRTLEATRDLLILMGHKVAIIAPDQYRSLPCPTYPEIRLSVAGARRVGRDIAATAPDAIHLSTEGPLCVAARNWCVARGIPFTTAFHTQFPDYVAARTGVPARWTWRYLRWFHAPAHAVLVSTPTLKRTLATHGIAYTRLWGRGVDLGQFTPDQPLSAALAGLPRPIQLYVGRVAVEKNLDAFLATSHPGSKVVVGDGPALETLRRRYTQAHFVGKLHGVELAAAYAHADVFVFPSRTDTFGLVMIEAMACGTPVAAYPVPGPIDVVSTETGALDPGLDAAITRALGCDRDIVAAYGRKFSWEASARQFLAALAPIERRIAA
ncbi:Glycosyltransferase subfamily 4-like N-terminal domain-containing protein [Sphingomonas antarctica]|uniref:glycosyltransferase family 4 protein n=1 Tax=Sphingomonas antarctica TaxID=2040274 RepID=UPI0039EC11D6